MLEHQKRILNALHNEDSLFLKEVQKSVEWLNDDELNELRRWLSMNYPRKYKTMAQRFFNKIPA